MSLQHPIKDKPKLTSVSWSCFFQSFHVGWGSSTTSSILCLCPLVSYALIYWSLDVGIFSIFLPPLTCLDYLFNSSNIIIQTQVFTNRPELYYCNGHVFCSLYTPSFSKAPINSIRTRCPDKITDSPVTV